MSFSDFCNFLREKKLPAENWLLSGICAILPKEMMFHILFIVHEISIAIKQSFLYTKHMRNRSDEMIHFEYGQWRPVQSVAVRGRFFIPSAIALKVEQWGCRQNWHRFFPLVM